MDEIVEDFVLFWRDLATVAEKSMNAGTTWVDREKIKTRISMFRAAADALEEGYASGRALCICCKRPRDQCFTLMRRQTSFKF